MVRRIIKIDEVKCNGCGVCAKACHEGAIDMVNGKAKLMRENYCDGLGDCLPICPTGAITFEEREAPAYDETAVMAAKKTAKSYEKHIGCPGAMVRTMSSKNEMPVSDVAAVSHLTQWPVQIKLAPFEAPFYEDAEILIAADCTAYAYGNFHIDFIKGRITLIGCPKLDQTDYAEKLCEIFKLNNIKNITVVRMIVPCCGGITNAVNRAIEASGKEIPCRIVTISTDGKIIS